MNATVDGDSLLRSLFGANAPDRDELIALIVTTAKPVVDAMLRGAFSSHLSLDDAADLRGEIVLKLMRRLHRIAEGSDEAPIDDFLKYVRTVSLHAITDHRRKLHPARARLATRIRYVLTHDSRLAVWENAGTICGLATFIGRPRARDAQVSVGGSLSGILGSPMAELEPGTQSPAALTPKQLREVVHRALVAANGPLLLDDLVESLSVALRLSDEESVWVAPAEGVAVSDPSERLVAQDYFAGLWAEIIALPLRQRQALLLSLRFDDGESIMGELPVMGLADFHGIARVLEMTTQSLLEMWNDLPLDDLQIAALMGDLSRQQVINLRKSARERLARRMHRT